MPIQVEYFGHSCFGLVSANQRCLIDPFPEQVGYKSPNRQALVTLVSHDHFDHSYTAAVNGRTQVIKGTAQHQVGPFQIRGVLCDHDNTAGQQFGQVVVFVVEVEGLSFAHLSDLGRPLSKNEVEEIGPVDVLFVPCGGGQYTLDNLEAVRVVEQVAPKLAVPMHFRTPFLNRSLFPQLEPPDQWAQKMSAKRGEGILQIDDRFLSQLSCRAIVMAHLG